MEPAREEKWREAMLPFTGGIGSRMSCLLTAQTAGFFLNPGEDTPRLRGFHFRLDRIILAEPSPVEVELVIADRKLVWRRPDDATGPNPFVASPGLEPIGPLKDVMVMLHNPGREHAMVRGAFIGSCKLED